MSNSEREGWFHPAMLMQPKAVGDHAWMGHPWIGHIPFAAWIIAVSRPRILVELGTLLGDSYFAFCQAAQDEGLESHFFAVDTWAGDKHIGYYDDSIFSGVNERNREFSNFSILLRMTFDEAVKQFEDGSIDLLHIDGLHTYEAVRHDFDTWLPKMSKAGIVLFHDTHEYRSDFGVWKLWRELKRRFKTIEFPHSHGLGVIFLNDVLPEKITKLLAEPELAQSAFRDRAQKIGLIAATDPVNVLSRIWPPSRALSSVVMATRIFYLEGWAGIKRKIKTSRS